MRLTGAELVMAVMAVWAAGHLANASELKPKAGVNARLERLEAEVQAAEDVSAIKRLQRAYGYYVDKGMWEDLSSFFTEDAIGNYPAGVFIGRESLRRHLFMNVGGVKLGEIGLGDKRLYNHMNIQPVVHLDPGGQTAKGRWRAFVTMGRYGASASWAEGIYENTYVKEKGIWKFRSVRFYPTFICDYDKGWANDAQPAPGVSAELHPDRPPTDAYEIYPKAHVPPFHYHNPVTGKEPRYPAAGGPGEKAAAAALAPLTKTLSLQAPKNVEAALAEVEREIERIRDFHELENLESAYGYYLDKNLWNQLADQRRCICMGTHQERRAVKAQANIDEHTPGNREFSAPPLAPPKGSGRMGRQSRIGFRQRFGKRYSIHSPGDLQ
jgi:hypothetical protein